MFCSNCGKELKEGAAFCTECGAPVKKVQPATAEAPKMAPPVQGQQGPQPGMPKRSSSGKTLGIILGCVGAAAVLLIAIVAALLLRKPRVNLNKYLDVSFEGYDTVGTAYYVFDTTRFNEDFGRKIKYNGNRRSGASQMLLNECVTGSLDVSRGLSNGDEIVFEWDCNDDIAKETYGCILKYKDTTYTVSGLKVAETFDPFEGIDVSFDGIAPDGHASGVFNTEEMMYRTLSFAFDQNSGLDNGDEVTLRVTDFEQQSRVESFITTYGKIPSPLEKTYTVEGLRSYVRRAEEIPEDLLERMKHQAEDVVRAQVAQNYDQRYLNTEKAEYQGYYLLTPKKENEYGNYIYVVYAVTPRITIPFQNYNQTITYYQYVMFKNVMLDGTGDGEVNINDYSTTDKRFNHGTTGAKYQWQNEVITFNGYSMLSELYQAVVTTQIDRYQVQEVTATGEETSGNTGASEEEEDASGEAGIIFPDSSERLLTEAEVSALSDEDLRSAINEMYARKGYIFKDDTIRAYYEQYDWYTPSVAPGDFKQSMFTETELANVELMQKVRDSR